MFFYVSINERIRGGLRTYFYISKIFNGMKQERKYGGVTTVNATEPQVLTQTAKIRAFWQLNLFSWMQKKNCISSLGGNVVLVRTK